MKKSTRIQSTGASFTLQFDQRCVGHSTEHASGSVVQMTAFYPKAVCQRSVHIWMLTDEKTPTTFLRKFKESVHIEEETHLCSDCGSSAMVSLPGHGCVKCTGMTSDDTESIMHAVAEVMRDIPEYDEGEASQSSLQKRVRSHRNFGSPPNRLLAHPEGSHGSSKCH